MWRMRRSACLLLLAVAACEPHREVAVIGHRGASWDAPEHTFASWDLALAQGADWLEFDLQRTADGALVIFHDDSLDRVARGPAADCSGPVAERTLGQLRRCDVGRWFNEKHPDRAQGGYEGLRIPTLDEVLERYGQRARLYIELKDPERAPTMAAEFHAALLRHGLAGAGAPTDRLLVQSFVPAALERFHALAPEVPLVQLLADSVPAAQLDGALARVAGYAVGIGPSGRILDERLVAAAHAKGLIVHPYTVNEEAQLRAVLDLGVDGVFTDRPALLRALLDVRRR